MSGKNREGNPLLRRSKLYVLFGKLWKAKRRKDRMNNYGQLSEVEEGPYMKAIEVRGIISKDRRLRVDTPLPVAGPSRVRVIVLIPEESDDIAEADWLKAASNNPAFDFLKEDTEEIYSPTDGRPLRDEK